MWHVHSCRNAVPVGGSGTCYPINLFQGCLCFVTLFEKWTAPAHPSFVCEWKSTRRLSDSALGFASDAESFLSVCPTLCLKGLEQRNAAPARMKECACRWVKVTPQRSTNTLREIFCCIFSEKNLWKAAGYLCSRATHSTVSCSDLLKTFVFLVSWCLTKTALHRQMLGYWVSICLPAERLRLHRII